MMTVVSGAISRSAQRYRADAAPAYALNAHPCTVKMRIGTRASAAADPPQQPRLRAVDVHDVRALPAHQRDQLDHAEQIVDGMQIPAHVSQSDEAGARGERRIAQRALAVRGDEHVEPSDERGQQGGHIGLRSARLGERDQQQDPGTGGHRAVSLYSGVMSAGQRAARRAAGVLVVALFAWWAVADGGYAPGAWYPGALVLLVAIAGCVRARMVRDAPPAVRLALAALAGLTVWSFCSIAWADARGDAWDGANRTLLYLMVFALFAVVPWTVAEAAAGLGAFALATAGVGAWEVARVVVAGADASVFVDGRLAAPVGYENASAALFLVAFWPALLLAAHRPAPAWARAILLATAGLLLELTILTQSRGALVAGVVTLILAIVFVWDRVPLLASLLAVAAVTAASLPTLLGVYEAAPREPDLGPVAIALGLSAAVLFATGLALERAARGRGRLVRAVAAAAVLLTTAGAALAIAAGTPADSRFAAGLGSGRYDFWRVATLEFGRHPLGGVGADNFAHDYVRERRRREEPLYPHSLALRTVTQLGAVGGALLALFVGAVVVAVRRLPSGDLGRSAVAVAALVAGSRLAGARLDRLAVGDAGRRGPGDGLPRPGRRARPAAARRSGPARRSPPAPAPRSSPASPALSLRAAGAVGEGGRSERCGSGAAIPARRCAGSSVRAS